MSGTNTVINNATIMEENKMDIQNVITMYNDLLNEYDIPWSANATSRTVRDSWCAKSTLRNILSKCQYWDEEAQAVVLRNKTILRSYNRDGANRFCRWAYKTLVDKGEPVRAEALEAMFHIMQNQLENGKGNLIDLAELPPTLPEGIAQPLQGQKWSRYFGKVCKEYGLNTVVDLRTEVHSTPDGETIRRQRDYGYNYHMALLGDSINPLEITGKTFVLSIHFIDYPTMSFGHDWASCHTIDKDNHRRCDHTYSGQYCGGTLSYALDNVTMIAYIVDEENAPKAGRNSYHHYGSDVPYCLRDKEHREVVAWDKDKFYFARVYPDGRDGGEEGIGAQFREIVQQIFAECLGVSNMWTTKKGTEYTSYHVQANDGNCAYPDWDNCEDGSISFLRRVDGILNQDTIWIGGEAICPNCGCSHCNTNHILCEDCENEGTEICYRCDEHFDPEDDEAVYITADDRWYCCARCAERDGYVMTVDGEWFDEGSVVYVEDDCNYYHIDDERICYCADDNDYHLAIDCTEESDTGDWYYSEDSGIQTADGEWYHNEDTAREHGYVLCDDDNEWHHISE